MSAASIETYGNYPRATISWPAASSYSYIIIQYYGNAIVGTGSISSQISSGALTGTTWTTGDLSFGALYTFTLTTYNSAGISGGSRQFIVNTTAPVLSSGGGVGISTTSSAQLQWGSIGSYSYVKLYRKITLPYTSDIVEVSYGRLFPAATTYYDIDISGNTTYLYYITPFDSNNTSYASSNTVSITTNAQAAAGLTMEFYDSSAVRISFTAPRNSYATSYYYQLNTTAVGVTTSASGQSAALTTTNLSGNTTYTYNVAVYLDGALAATSSSGTVTTTAQSVRDLSASFYDSSSVQVSFSAPRNSYTSSYYYLFNATSQNAGVPAISLSGQTNTYTATNLSGNTSYTYTVGVYLDGALSATTAGSSAITTAAQSVRDLTAAFYDSSALQVSFTAPRNSYTSTYYYQLNTAAGGVITSASGQSAALTATNLSGNTSYTYTIGLYLDGALRATTAGSAAVTTAAQRVENMTAAFYDSSAITIGFSLPRNYYSSTYYYQLNTTAAGVTTSASGQSAALTTTNLSGNTSYTYTIGVYLDGALRATTAGAAAVTTAAQAAANLAAAFYDSSALQVSFTLPRNYYTTSYYYQLNTTAVGVTTSASGQSAELTTTNLSGNTSYTYTIGVYLDGALRATTAGAAAVVTAAQSAANLTAAFYDSSALQVSFTLPRNSYTTSYYYQLNTTTAGVTTSASGQSAALTATNLSGNTSYTYTIGVYLDGVLRTTTAGSAAVTTAAQSAANLAASFYDSSALQVSFTLPRNSYTTSYYYQLNTTAAGVTTSASGQSASLTVTNLSGNTSYTYTIGVYLDGVLRTTTAGAAAVTTATQSAANLAASFYDSSAITIGFSLPRNSYTTSYYYQLNTTAAGVTTSASGQSAALTTTNLSGNTSYTYTIGVYLDGVLRTTTAGAAAVTTATQSASNLSASFYDSSAITIGFSLPRNSYTSTYYYKLNTTWAGITTSASGQSAALTTTNLSGNTSYTYTIGVYLDGVLRTTTAGSAAVVTAAQAPTNLTTVFYDNSSVRVSFTLPRNYYSSTYYYQLNTSAAGVTTSASGQSAALTTTNLSGNTSYTYTIGVYLDGSLRATTAGAATVTTTAQAASNLTATFYDSSSVRVSFTLPRNSYTTSYYYQLNAITSGVTTTASGQAALLTATNLSGNTSYTYTVGVYLDGALRATTAGSAAIITAVQPATNLATSSYDSSSVSVSFNLPRNSYTTSYYYQLNTTAAGITTSASGQSAALTTTNLSGNTSYTYTVGVYLDGALRTTTAGAAAVTTAAQPATNLSTTFYDSSAITIAFSLPRNSYTSTYYYQLNTVLYGVTQSASGQTTPITIYGLSGNALYTCYVLTYLDGSLKATSYSTSVTTNAQSPTNITNSFTDSSSIQFTFTLPRNNYTSTYYYQLNATTSGVTTSVSGQTSPLFVKGLTDGTTYTCNILTYLDGTLKTTSNTYYITTTSSSNSFSGLVTAVVTYSAKTMFNNIIMVTVKY